jgi:hypothetical protein
MITEHTFSSCQTSFMKMNLTGSGSRYKTLATFFKKTLLYSVINCAARPVSLCIYVWKLKKPPLTTPVLLYVLFPILSTSFKIEHSHLECCLCLSICIYCCLFWTSHSKSTTPAWNVKQRARHSSMTCLSLCIYVWKLKRPPLPMPVLMYVLLPIARDVKQTSTPHSKTQHALSLLSFHNTHTFRCTHLKYYSTL